MLRDMPGGPAIWCHGEPSEQIKRTMIGFVRVDVELPTDLHIPPLPLKGDGTHGPKGKLIFPVGNLTGIWEWEELQLALEVGGHIQRWYESVWYEPVPMFVKYVNRLWSFRDKTRRDYDPTLDAIAKSLLNSLYGKFGQKLLREKYWHRDDPKMPMELCKPLHGDDLESLVWKSEEEIDSTYIIPQVAARVTALSRIRLYRGFQEIQRNGGRVYYCDTDSIVAHGEMQTGFGLGEWKDEHPEYHAKLYGGFYGPKFYTIWAADGWRKVRAKGVQPQGDTPQCREQNLFDQFTALASGRSIVTKRLEKVGSLGRVQFQRGPKIVTVPRTLRNANPKREDLEDGRTKPYELKMW
jgi:hypothetical protein